MISRMMLSVAIIASPAASASSQTLFETLAGAKFCRTLKEDTQRLKCFDELFMEKPTRETPKAETEAIWNITEDKSPIDDSPQIVAYLMSKGESIAGALTGTPALLLRCKEQKTEAIFYARFNYLGTDLIKVLVRINDGKPLETTWSPDSGGQGVFAPSPVQFIRALPEQGKLFIRAAGFNGKKVDGEFNLGNVSEVREKIAKACNWGSTKPTPPQAITPKSAPQAKQ